MTFKRIRGLIFTGFFGAVSLVVSMSSANAGLIIGDANYVGSITPNHPSNPASEVGYINYLITLAAGTGDTTSGTETYNREGSSLNGVLPAAVLADAFKDESSAFTINLTGSSYQYILGKYDASKAGALVWFSNTGFTGEVSLPGTFNGQGISHISGYNLTSGIPFIPVPEPGAWSLFGLGLLGLGLSRRRLRGYKNRLNILNQ